MKTKFNLPIPKLLSILLSTSLLITICLSACKKNDNGLVDGSAYVMAVNAAQGSAPQDFYVDNMKYSQSAIAYTENTPYIPVAVFGHTVDFRNSGNINASAATVGVLDSYSSVFFTDNNETFVTRDDRTAPAAGKARVRFVHLSSAIKGAVDFGITSGNKIVSSLAYKTASTYFDIDPSTAFSLYLAGQSTVALAMPTSVQAGKIYTIYISGSSNATIRYMIIAQS